MSVNSIKANGLLFNCSTFQEKFFKESTCHETVNDKLKDILNLAMEELKANNVDLSKISQIEIRDSNIVYYLNGRHNNNPFSPVSIGNLSHKINTLPHIDLRFQRDLIGEKILTVSKAKSFANLYLYSSGGGGHKSAKEAEMERNFKHLMEHVKCEIETNGILNIDVEINHQELEKGKCLIRDERLENPAKLMEWCKQMELVKDIDVLHDFLGDVGMWASHQWDSAQQAGDVKKQESLASKQWLSDLFFGPIIFISTLRSLINFQPKKVVSTQAQATPSILLAIKLYNIFFKPSEDPDVKLHLYMTDMPTEYAQHFFDSLKRVSVYGGKEQLILYSPKAEEEMDWQKLCGLSKEQVRELDVQELPVRSDFLEAVNAYEPDIENPSVEIKVGEQLEMQLLHAAMQHQSGQAFSLGEIDKEGTQFLNYPMQPEDSATFIMLGSQPTKSAIEKYVQEYLALAQDNPTVCYHVFAFAGRFEGEKDCFYKQLVTYITSHRDWPSNLRVVPLSYQTSKQLVSLEIMCDTFTRSGGLTTMELRVLDEVYKKFPHLRRRKRFIHAQPVEGRTLEESIPLWEKGNYFFLKKTIQARVIAPHTFRQVIEKPS